MSCPQGTVDSKAMEPSCAVEACRSSFFVLFATWEPSVAEDWTVVKGELDGLPQVSAILERDLDGIMLRATHWRSLHLIK
jgi:hypothetical protein